MTNKFAIDNCTQNGIAIGSSNQAILGCNAAAPLQVISLDDGSVVASIPQVNGGCDEVWYDAGENHYLAACSQHNVSSPFYVAGVIDASTQSLPPRWDQVGYRSIFAAQGAAQPAGNPIPAES